MNEIAKPSSSWVFAAVFVTAVAINAFDYSVLVPQQQVRLDMHRRSWKACRHRAPDSIADSVAARSDHSGISRAMSGDRAITRTYAALHLAALDGLLAVVYCYARISFTREIGALLVGSTVPLALRQGEYVDASPIPLTSVFSPSSLLDDVITRVALITLHHDRRVASGCRRRLPRLK